MKITIDTNEALTPVDINIVTLLVNGGDIDALAKDEPAEAPKPEAAKPKAKPAKKAKAKPEPEPEPEPMAEEPVEEEEPEEEPEVDEVEEQDEDADEMSDEDLLEMAVKKATKMVSEGGAADVRKALDAAGASRVRELNKDNVREFFEALP